MIWWNPDDEIYNFSMQVKNIETILQYHCLSQIWMLWWKEKCSCITCEVLNLFSINWPCQWSCTKDTCHPHFSTRRLSMEIWFLPSNLIFCFTSGICHSDYDLLYYLWITHFSLSCCGPPNSLVEIVTLTEITE